MTAKRRSSTAETRNPGAVTPLPVLPAGTREGSLLLEAIIAIGVFSLFLAGIGLSLLVGERSTVAAGDRVRAAFLAEQQLEGVRQMRNTSYASVTTGQHGIALGSSGWAWSGSTLKVNGYTGSVTVSSVGTDWLQAVSNVRWDFGKARSGSVVLTTYLTDWRKVATVGNWANMTRIANVTPSGTPDFQKVAVSGTYAFLTGTQASGGKGLYIYDISNPASPTQVNTSFNLGASAYGLAIAGNRLYLATNSATQEVQVYDITDPTTMTTSSLVNSFDLPGSGNARSITVYGSHVFVGTLDDPPNKQFTSIEMSETGPMVQNDALGMSGSVLDLALQDGYAYAATAYNTGEVQVADIFDPENLTFAPGTGVDMTDTYDAYAVALSGTSALVGRALGSSIDELTLYDVGLSPVPSPPPGPWTVEIGSAVNDLATIFGNKYAFVANGTNNAEIKVIDLVKFAQSAAPVVKNYDTNATMKGVYYDWQTDRLFSVSAGNFMVFAPG